jgi:hypothetical protein
MSRRLIIGRMRADRVGDVVGEMTTKVGGATIASTGVRSAGGADTRAGKRAGTCYRGECYGRSYNNYGDYYGQRPYRQNGGTIILQF